MQPKKQWHNTIETPVKEPLGCGKSAGRNNSLACTFGETWATWYFGVQDWGYSMSSMGVTLGYIYIYILYIHIYIYGPLYDIIWLYISYITSQSWDRGPTAIVKCIHLSNQKTAPPNWVIFWKVRNGGYLGWANAGFTAKLALICKIDLGLSENG